MDIMRSVVGMVVLLAIAFVLSVNKRASACARPAALLLQIAIGGIMPYFPRKWGRAGGISVHKGCPAVTQEVPLFWFAGRSQNGCSV